MSTSKGLPYFFNTQTKQSSWEAPSGLTPEQINQLPGAKQYLSKEGGGGANAGKVRASHLLVKHRDSRRPSSWKEVGIHPLASLDLALRTFGTPEQYYTVQRRGYRHSSSIPG